MKTILILLALAIFLSASKKIPHINNLLYEIVKSDFNKSVVKTHKNKIYKQHYPYGSSQHKFIGFYKDFAIFFFDEYKTGLFENDGYIYTSKDKIGMQDAYILVKKQKNTVYLKGLSFLLGYFKLVGVRDFSIYPFYNLKAIELKKIKPSTKLTR